MELLNKFLITLVCWTIFTSKTGNVLNREFYSYNRIIQEELDDQLIYSARAGNLVGVQRALDKGADIHAKNDLALQASAFWGHMVVLRFLVEHGANLTVLTTYQKERLYSYFILELRKKLYNKDGQATNILMEIAQLLDFPETIHKEAQYLVNSATEK